MSEQKDVLAQCAAKLPEKDELPRYPSSAAREWAADAISEMRECNDRFCNESGYLLAQYFHLAFASGSAARTPAACADESFAQALADICDDLGCARDNEAALMAIKQLRDQVEELRLCLVAARNLLNQRAAGYEARGFSIFNGNILAEELRGNAERIGQSIPSTNSEGK